MLRILYILLASLESIHISYVDLCHSCKHHHHIINNSDGAVVSCGASPPTVLQIYILPYSVQWPLLYIFHPQWCVCVRSLITRIYSFWLVGRARLVCTRTRDTSSRKPLWTLKMLCSESRSQCKSKMRMVGCFCCCCCYKMVNIFEWLRMLSCRRPVLVYDCLNRSGQFIRPKCGAHIRITQP